jgi:phage terminase large subunit
MQTTWIDAEVPKKLAFFFEWGKWRYKVARGGRGSAKSRTISAALVVRGLETPLRWLCARETQKSLQHSSRQILVDAINRLGLQSEYEILTNEIRGKRVYADGRRTLFIFAGIKEMSVDSIKSLEDFDGIWIAEAHALSETSWNTITPTFRRAGSEIWVDYNPDLEEDFIHRWCNNPPPNAKIVHVNYYDNPWFPSELRVDMEHMQATDPVQYRHVWLGEARNNVVGAVYGREMGDAYDEGRIVKAPGLGVDRAKPVDVFFDLGHGDPMALWFAQMVNGWVNILDFYQNEGHSIEHYVSVIQAKNYRIGTLWMPWDGVDAQLHHRLTGNNMRSPEQVVRSLGLRVRIAPKTAVESGIGAVRTLFPQMRFDETKCYEGIRHLRMYQWGPKPESGVVQTKPKHDEHSHAADALKTLAVSIKETPEETIDTSWKPAPVLGGRTWAG